VSALIQAEADINAKDKFNRTALTWGIILMKFILTFQKTNISYIKAYILAD
jgi:hypothetical protein